MGHAERAVERRGATRSPHGVPVAAADRLGGGDDPEVRVARTRARNGASGTRRSRSRTVARSNPRSSSRSPAWSGRPDRCAYMSSMRHVRGHVRIGEPEAGEVGARSDRSRPPARGRRARAIDRRADRLRERRDLERGVGVDPTAVARVRRAVALGDARPGRGRRPRPRCPGTPLRRCTRRTIASTSSHRGARPAPGAPDHAYGSSAVAAPARAGRRDARAEDRPRATTQDAATRVRRGQRAPPPAGRHPATRARDGTPVGRL